MGEKLRNIDGKKEHFDFPDAVIYCQTCKKEETIRAHIGNCPAFRFGRL